MKQRMYYPFLLFSLFAAAVLMYQNCGEMRLKPQPRVASSEVYNYQKLGAFCAPDSVPVNFPQKFIFITDMSASNLGKILYREVWVQGNFYGYNQQYISCPPQTTEDINQLLECTDNCPPVDCPKATDPQGTRFGAVESFVMTCPQAQSANAKFALIGFSNNYVKPKDYQGRSCTDLLTDKDTFVTENRALLQIQKDYLINSPHPPTGQNQPKRSLSEAFLMRATSYLNAIKCYRDKVFEDINPSDMITDYKVFFLTDGKPSDDAASVAQYDTVLADINSLFETYHYRARFTPIYYGPESEFADAKTRLDSISVKANALSTFQETIRLDPSSGTFQSALSDALCRTPAPITNVPFRVHSYYAINLSNHQRGTRLVVDSDSDGISDEDEVAPFDPTKSHSRKLLDGLCVLNQSACETFESTPNNCDPSVPVGIGFNQCDQKFANILIGPDARYRPFDGIDYDHDDILDYVEILKGTNPFTKDLNENADGDEWNDKAEIIQGTDPRSTTSPELLESYGSDFKFSPDSSSCSTSGSYMVEGRKFPVLETQAILGESFATQKFSSGPSENFLRHESGENLVLLVYLAAPAAHQTSSIHYYARIVKVKGKQVYQVSDMIDVGVGQ